jgi:Tol biopolymer transport system component
MSLRSITLLFLLTILITACAAQVTPRPEPTIREPGPQFSSPSETNIPNTLAPTKTNPAPNSTFTPVPQLEQTLPPTTSLAATEMLDEFPTDWDFSKYGAIAYMTDSYAIRMLNADGSRVDWSYDTNLSSINDFAWSSDGKFIALAKTGDIGSGEIFILSIKDKTMKNIAESLGDSIIDSPAISPDGKRILFFAYNEGSIYKVNINGTGLVNLTPDAIYRNSSEYPSWSPSGEQVLYSRRPDGQIYIMNTDGTGVRKLTTSGFNEHPLFSPDGRWIAFMRSAGSNRYLYMMPAGGGSLRALTGDTQEILDFTWSPDGRFIAFSYFPQNVRPLVVKFSIVDTKTGKSWEIKTPERTWYPLAWSPVMATSSGEEVEKPREDCTDGWTRLKIGGFARLIGEVPNRVRAAAEKSGEVIGQFLAGESYILLNGPVCADGMVFWEIRSKFAGGLWLDGRR